MAKKYFLEYHALCFSENRKGISQIYPKIEDFAQFILFWIIWGIKIQLHLFRLKQVLRRNAFLASVKGMLMKNGHNSASNGSF